MQIRLQLQDAQLDAFLCKEVFGTVGHHLQPLSKAIDQAVLELTLTERSCGAKCCVCRLAARFTDGRTITVERSGSTVLKTVEETAKRGAALAARLAHTQFGEVVCIRRLPAAARVHCP